MQSRISQSLQRCFFTVVFVISFFIVFTYLISMGLGVLVVFSTTEGLNFALGEYPFYPLLVLNWEVTTNAGLYFVFLWWVFTSCFVAAWKYKESLSSKLKDFFSGPTIKHPFRNNLLAMPMITSMLLVAIFVLEYLQGLAGVSSGSPIQGDPFLDFLRISRAPLVEEILFRIFPIGSFLVTYIYVAGKRIRPNFSLRERIKTCFLSLVQPERAKEKLGLITIGEYGLLHGVTWAEWIIVFFTSSLFGLAHYFGGWGFGKISQAALTGAVFALAYLYYGIQAPILLHWFFNYYFYVFGLSLDYYSPNMNLYFISVSTTIFLGVLMWLAAIFFVVLLLVSLVRKALKKRTDTIFPKTSGDAL